MLSDVYLALVGKDYNYLTVVIEGEKAIEKFVQNNRNQRIIQLNEQIYLAHDIKVLFDNTKKTTRYYRDAAFVLPLLENLQKDLDQLILVAPLIPTPARMRKAFQENPRAILEKVRDVSSAAFDKGDEWIPILFNDFGDLKVGYQHRVKILQQLDCLYTIETENMEVSNVSQVRQAFMKVLYWEDWLGLKQYYGTFKLFSDRFEYAGTQANTDKLLELKFPFREITSMHFGFFSLTIKMGEEEHQFSIGSFNMRPWKLSKLLQKAARVGK